MHFVFAINFVHCCLPFFIVVVFLHVVCLLCIFCNRLFQLFVCLLWPCRVCIFSLGGFPLLFFFCPFALFAALVLLFLLCLCPISFFALSLEVALVYIIGIG